jgi:hypothetical protein
MSKPIGWWVSLATGIRKVVTNVDCWIQALLTRIARWGTVPLREAAMRAYDENRHGRTINPAEAREEAEDPLKYYALKIYSRCLVYGCRKSPWRFEIAPSPNYSRYHLEYEGNDKEKDFILRDTWRNRIFRDLHVKNNDLQTALAFIKSANAEDAG